MSFLEWRTKMNLHRIGYHQLRSPRREYQNDKACRECNPVIEECVPEKFKVFWKILTGIEENIEIYNGNTVERFILLMRNELEEKWKNELIWEMLESVQCKEIPEKETEQFVWLVKEIMEVIELVGEITQENQVEEIVERLKDQLEMRIKDKDKEWEEFKQWIIIEHQAKEKEINPMIKKWFKEVIDIMEIGKLTEEENRVIQKRTRLIVTGIEFNEAKEWDELATSAQKYIQEILDYRKTKGEVFLKKQKLAKNLEKLTGLLERKFDRIPRSLMKNIDALKNSSDVETFEEQDEMITELIQELEGIKEITEEEARKLRRILVKKAGKLADECIRQIVNKWYWNEEPENQEEYLQWEELQNYRMTQYWNIMRENEEFRMVIARMTKEIQRKGLRYIEEENLIQWVELRDRANQLILYSDGEYEDEENAKEKDLERMKKDNQEWLEKEKERDPKVMEKVSKLMERDLYSDEESVETYGRSSDEEKSEQSGEEGIMEIPEQELEENEKYWKKIEQIRKDLKEKDIELSANKITNVLNMTKDLFERKYWSALELWQEYVSIQDELETVIKEMLLLKVEELKLYERDETERNVDEDEETVMNYELLKDLLEKNGLEVEIEDIIRMEKLGYSSFQIMSVGTMRKYMEYRILDDEELKELLDREIFGNIQDNESVNEENLENSEEFESTKLEVEEENENEEIVEEKRSENSWKDEIEEFEKDINTGGLSENENSESIQSEEEIENLEQDIEDIDSIFTDFGRLFDELQEDNNNMAEVAVNRLRAVIEAGAVSVPEFYGGEDDNVEEWIEQVETAARIAGITWDGHNPAVASFALRGLKDEALRWYGERKRAQAGHLINWTDDNHVENLKHHIREKFLTEEVRNKKALELQAMKQRDGEKVKGYALRFKKLSKLVGNHVNDGMKKEFFIKGLKRNLVAQVRFSEPADLQAAIDRAKMVERIENEGEKEEWKDQLNRKGEEELRREYSEQKNIFKKSREQIEEDADDIVKRMERMQLKIEKMEKNQNKGQNYNSKRSTYRNGNNRRGWNPECYNCHEKGHVASSCPRKKIETKYFESYKMEECSDEKYSDESEEESESEEEVEMYSVNITFDDQGNAYDGEGVLNPQQFLEWLNEETRKARELAGPTAQDMIPKRPDYLPKRIKWSKTKGEWYDSVAALREHKKNSKGFGTKKNKSESEQMNPNVSMTPEIYVRMNEKGDKAKNKAMKKMMKQD